ncbi:hypothetical protein IJS77_04680 [bacterium]|nr:hypothetical protein [bacterium]
MGYYKKLNPHVKNYDMRITTKIISEVERIDYGEGRIKTVFQAQSETGTPRTVIYWGENNAEKGDEVLLTGFLNGDKFIAKIMLIVAKAERKEQK